MHERNDIHMKRKFICLILIIINFLILASCIKTSNSNDKIQLWFYDFYREEVPYMTENKAALKIIDSAKKFCEENDIPLEVFIYTADSISLEDYILKRNLSAASGNMISIDNIYNLFDLAKHHADYTKLDNYENLLDFYKGEFCIPLCIEDKMDILDNKLLELNNLSTDKKLITYCEYLDIKQKLKEKGVKFELSREEILELIDYHLYSNKVLYLNENSKIIDDDIAFKKTLKKILLDICNDIISYYDSSDFELINEYSKYLGIKDKVNGIIFHEILIQEKLINPYIEKFDVLNNTFFMSPTMDINNPSFFMHKKITNDKIYDLANHIVSEEMYLHINEKFDYLPVFKVKKAKDLLMLDENNKYVGNARRSQELREFIDTRYHMLLNDGDIARDLANNYFSNRSHVSDIKFFVLNLIKDIAATLSNDKLSLDNFDSNNEEINNMIDKRIDEFVFNFELRNK